MSARSTAAFSRSFLLHARVVLLTGRPGRRLRHLAEQIDDHLEALEKLVAEHLDDYGYASPADVPTIDPADIPF